MQRTDASRILSQLPDFAAPPLTFRLVEGERCYPRRLDENPLLVGRDDDEFRKFLALKTIGLVDVERRQPVGEECGTVMQTSQWFDVVSVFLTEAGKRNTQSWGQHPESGWMIPLSTKKFAGVSGITYSDEFHQTALVEFLWQVVPTEVGRAFGLTDTPRKASAHFRRYDDGWRLESTDGIR